MGANRRRQAGEGTIAEYTTNAGKRFLIKATVGPEGDRRQVLRRGFATRKEAATALRDLITKSERPEGFSEPSKMTLGEYLDQWLEGLRGVRPTTLASYKKNVRLHIKPALGAIPLRTLTSARIARHYRHLETEGRQDHKAGQPLSARTVRYVHTILRAALSDAVESRLLDTNPADSKSARPPAASSARAPEMRTWTAEELRTFLTWSQSKSVHHVAWATLAATGLRRGELLALRWRDVDLDTGVIQIRRSVSLVKAKGAKTELVETVPKTGRARVVDLDPATTGLLRGHRRDRGSLALTLARDDALVFATVEGAHLNPDRFSRQLMRDIDRCRRDLGDKGPSEIRLHDLRHTWATLALQAGVHPKVVQERLGHSNISITLDTYSHVAPTMQRDAAAQVALLIYGGGA